MFTVIPSLLVLPVVLCSWNLTMFWTTPWANRFTERHRAVLDSYIYHHPQIHITVYHSHPDELELFSAYKQINFVSMDNEWFLSIRSKCPYGHWLEQAKNGQYYYSHLTDYLRFCLLFLHGGMYSDFDAILLRSLDSLIDEYKVPNDVLVIGKDEIGAGESCTWCFSGGRHYAAPGVMIAMKPGLSILKDAMTEAFSQYRIDVFGWAGPQALTKAIKRDRSKQAFLLPSSALYPLNWKNAHLLFERDSSKSRLWTRILCRSHSIHFYGSTTKNLTIKEGSIMSSLLKSSVIWNQNGNVFSVGNHGCKIDSLFRITKGNRVLIDTSNGTLSENEFYSDSIVILNLKISQIIYSMNDHNYYDHLNIRVFENNVEIATKSILIVNLSKCVTVVTKTFGRMSKVFDLVDSIKKKYSQLTVLVGDDGKEANLEGNYRGFQYFPFPYDIGLSEGRNLLISMVKTEFTFLVDDDFVFTEESDLIKLLRIAIDGNVDITGAKIPNDFESFKYDYSGLMQIKNQKLLLEPGLKGKILDCDLVEFIPNVFLAKTRILSQVRWDSSLKLGEHEDFFLRAKRQAISVASCPQVAFEHRQVKFWENKTEYDKMRLRVFSFMQKALDKNGLTELWTMGKKVIELMNISKNPLTFVKVQPFPYSARLILFPDKNYFRFKIQLLCSDHQLALFDDYNPEFELIDLEADTEYLVNVWAGNHTHYANIPKIVKFKTLSTNDNLLINGDFTNDSEWNATLRTTFNFVPTAIASDNSGVLAGRSIGHALGISVISERALRPYSIENQFYHSVHQTVKFSKKLKGEILLTGWSRPDHFILMHSTHQVLGYRLQLDLHFRNGTIVSASSSDFNHSLTKWQSKTVSFFLGEHEDYLEQVTVRAILDADRAAAFFDDFYLAIITK